MRSLFAKIFLWFWLAMLAMGAGLLLAQRQWADLPPLPTPAAMQAYADEAAARLAAPERRALRQWLGELNRGQAIHFYVFDARGRELGLRRAPPQVVGHAMRPRDEGPLRRWLAPPHLRVQAFSADGRDYRLVAARPPGGAFDALPLPLRLLLAVLISGGVCLLLAGYLTRPIRRVRRAASAFADGDWDARAEPGSRRDEIGGLARDFNAMAARVQALLQSQRRLLTDVSHELRSPLARLQVALALARRRTAPEAGEALDRIEREAERLDALIGEVLTLARLETTALRPDSDQVDLRALVEEVVADADFEAGQLGKQVILTDYEVLSVRGDAQLLRSALENVVRNGVRYTAAGTAVELSLRRDGGDALLRVHDHGPGVPAAELEHIFEPFVRVSAARERDSGGYGLGLAIARRAVTAHGGGIGAANAEEGGLRVSLRLPIA